MGIGGGVGCCKLGIDTGRFYGEKMPESFHEFVVLQHSTSPQEGPWLRHREVS